MNKLRKTMAALSAVMVMAAFFSCGKDSETSGTADEPAGVTSAAETSERDNLSSEDDKSNPSGGKGNSSSSSKSPSDSSSESGKASESSPDSQGKKPSGSSSASSSEQTSSSSPSGSGSSTGGQPSSGGSSSGGAAQSTPSGSGGSAVNPEPEPETDVYTAEITLGSAAKYTGSNVSVNGSVTTINGGGDYHITGTVSDGQLVVNTTEKVKLHLDGASISCSYGPAILVEDAKRITIRLMEGTTTTLTDGGKDKVCDGVIFSNDTVEIRGKGALNIVAGNAHGIASDDDVIIENGNINITSIKSGIHANDDITINGGNLTVKGGTNGIKSKGTLHINGGYSVISGGTKEEKSSLYSAGAFEYTGGTLFAAGNKVTAPTSSVSPYVVAGFTNSKSAGSSVSLRVNGAEAVNFVPHNDFKCVMMLSPELNEGSLFTANVGGTDYGAYTVSSDNSKNIFTLE